MANETDNGIEVNENNTADGGCSPRVSAAESQEHGASESMRPVTDPASQRVYLETPAYVSSMHALWVSRLSR